MCRPYLVAACVLAFAGLPFVAVKAIMLRHKLMSRWGSLLLSSAVFSVVHVIVAFNVYIFSRMRRRVSALPHVSPGLLTVPSLLCQ